ncbi:GatB/YqeY domain-containing protein [Neolewinella litorea]|uniref:GatB/YqeY domain-containing protein n=1 Tax=Neolewinella litorea TaxID=2562452 RepID=A0A4S4NFX3_9BACT|nr:GatB/YqeY domain-containing protein [Neolewinella litorea]THH37527.1 GatB/YqeY domain-containing protein [Neolewinella litorea]
MTLQDRITPDLKDAMRAKDQAALRGIRAIKNAILLQQTDGSGETLDEAGEIALLQKLVKSRQESLEIYEKQGREDLAQPEREEIEVISRYLPEQLSDEKLEAIVKEVIAETGATSMRDMGKVMGAANARVAGRADGKQIAATVKRLLA